MPETKTYLLQMLFDAAQIEVADLEARVKAAVVDHVSQINLQFETTEVGLLMSLQGSLEAADECHHQINTALLGASPLSCVRLVDEAGDEVRSRAYPVLSSIEQRLRSFVNRKAVEVLGFGWWNLYAPATLQAKVSSYVRKDVGVTLLEGTQFDDLVELITHEYSEWTDDKSLSVAELSQLMTSSSSFEEFQAHLAAKTARFSLWDKVFAPYFNDLEGWAKVKSVLHFVIKERHKVMHHRPMRLATVAVLVAKEQEITALFGASKITLAKPEREKAQQEFEQVLPSYGSARLAEWRSTPSDADMERFLALLPTMRDLERQQRWLQETIPTPGKLAEQQRTLLATLPSEAELNRTLERIQAALPTPEQAKEEAERTNKMLKNALAQSESLLHTTRMRNMVVPDPKLVEQIQTIEKNIAPVQAMWEQLQRFHGRRGF